MSPKIGVLLSGCGVSDGSEIHESVLTLLAIDKAGATAVCMAPNIEQKKVINHLTQKQEDEKRNVLVESARIARGDIKDIKDVSASDIDALIMPGGFGAVTNLSDFAEQGPKASIINSVQRLIDDMAKAKKPIGALCIAPAALAKAFSGKDLEVTIGNDQNTASAIEAMGAKHVVCSVKEAHVDSKNKVVTTPAYMLGPGIKDIAAGIEDLVEKTIEMIS